MPEISPTYKLEYFERGSYYSSESDFKRFTTLDYNMESYVGIVGVGIINGWTIEHLGGLSVQIIPGKGVIEEYFSEHPYVVKLRSQLDIPDREVAVFPGDIDNPGPYLTPVQRAKYISVITAYDPDFNAPDEVEDLYVKAAIPFIIPGDGLFLADTSDNYIYAQLKFDKPYPALNDYPLRPGNPPVREDYETEVEFEQALVEFWEQIEVIHEYEWFTPYDPLEPGIDYHQNHFTEVTFGVSTFFVPISSKILLAKVVTRNGNVIDIDTRGIDSIENLESRIGAIATELLVEHRHGGSNPWDPPKIRLETDIRKAVLSNYASATGSFTFNVLQDNETEVTEGHKHTFEIDSNGDGITLDKIGSGNAHFHKISSSIVQSPETSPYVVVDHIHVLDDTGGDLTWTISSRYVIYVNGERFADETSSNVEVDSDNKTITFLGGGIGTLFNKYSTTFNVSGSPYTFTARAASVYRYMLLLQADYYNTYSKVDDQGQTIAGGEDLTTTNVQIDSTTGQQVETTLTGSATRLVDTLANPFLFFTDETQIEITGLEDLKAQSRSAQSLLKNIDDQFTFTPDAARDITITLIEGGLTPEGIDFKNYSVEIEILGDVEVTGTLRSESVLYVNAAKITTGELDVRIIPFVSHVGRLLETCFPDQMSLSSDDAVRYKTIPGITTSSVDHYHRLSLNENLDGITTDVMVSDKPVYYSIGKDGDKFLIAHTHGALKGIVQSVSSTGLAQWQNDLTGSNVSSISHTHLLETPITGDGKVVYSIKEDVNGNLYVGTSDGLIMIPSDPSYQFVLNGFKFYFYGNDLWTLFEEARLEYEKVTGVPFPFEESVYLEQIQEAESELLEDGDSILLYGVNDPDRPQDVTMIKRISSFHLPNFRAITEKAEAEVLEGEDIIGRTTEIETTTNEDGESEEQTVAKVIVLQDFNNTPVWSIAIRSVSESSDPYVAPTTHTDLITVGSDLVGKNINIERSIYQQWQSIKVPFQIGIVRKVIRDSYGDYWFATDDGLLVSRSYSDGDDLTPIEVSATSRDFKDVQQGDIGVIYAISSEGIFQTSDRGKTWFDIFDFDRQNHIFDVCKDISNSKPAFPQIVRDYTIDKSTTVNGHYHELNVNSEGTGFLGESIGTGTSHVHRISDWTIAVTLGHTHDLVLTLYANDESGDIWKSQDSGATWNKFSELTGEVYELIFAAFGRIFVNKEDGLYVTSNGSKFTRVIKEKVYSFSWDYNLLGFLVGTANGIYKTMDGWAFSLVYAFSGYPFPVLLRNDVQQYFGYAFGNKSQVFHFKDRLVTTDTLSALVDYDFWRAQNGLWPASIPYDIYVDERRILSTKFDEDKRQERGYNFEVYPVQNLIDFSVRSSLVEDVEIDDIYVSVANAVGFTTGDRILIQTNAVANVVSVNVAAATTNAVFNTLVDITTDQIADFTGTTINDITFTESTVERKMYANITAINRNILTIDSGADTKIEEPAIVAKVVPTQDIIVNIYDSPLGSVGSFTHDQVEDYLSGYTDGRPYQFNDTYLSNLLQLTQAVKYVYPDIDSEMINAAFYDFHYSDLQNPNPDLPDINDFIDVLTSEIYSQRFFDSGFVPRFARSINKILVGFGNFSGNIIVATDIGLFWAKLEDNYEANWFYVSNLPYAVYDVMIFANERMMVATANGTYSSTDMWTWQLEASRSLYYPSYTISLRWLERDIITLPPHDAYFRTFYVPEEASSSSESSEATPIGGYITAAYGTPYTSIKENYSIKIENAGDKNGSYIVKAVNESGTRLTVSEPFPGPDGFKEDIEITMGPWWTKWEGDENLANSNITNTLLVGGKNNISYNNYEQVWTWNESNFPISNFVARKFMPLSSGGILLAATGNELAQTKNYLLKSNDIGAVWNTYKGFDEIRGTIQSSTITSSNNTLLGVSYTQPSDYIYTDGELMQGVISIFASDSTLASYTGRIIWNSSEVTHQIVVFGNEAQSLVGSSVEYTFVVYPLKINAIVENTSGTMFFGTDRGVYYDLDSMVLKIIPKGSIITPGLNATVSEVDLSGRIVSIGINDLTNNSVLSVNLTQTISGDELIGKTLYLTDVDPVMEYEVVDNSGVTITGEVTIEIDGLLTIENIGKLFTVAGDFARLYINYENPVLSNIYDGGTLYVVPNPGDVDAAGNIPEESYSIKKNTQTYIDLDQGIVPPSTLKTPSAITSSSLLLRAGKTVRIVDASGRLTLAVSLSQEYKENRLAGKNMTMTTGGNIRFIDDITIHSSTEETITLDSSDRFTPLDFNSGDLFQIDGVFFERLSSFNAKKASVELDHYHDLDLVGDVTYGDIQSLVEQPSSLVEISVTDTYNWTNPIIQQPGGNTLLKGAKIVFTNKNNVGLQYETTVVSHTISTILVDTERSSDWSFDAYDSLKISPGWQWKIDATYYGYTSGTFYKDFVVATSKATEDIDRSDTSIKVESTTGMTAGDKIRLQDDTLSSEVSVISSVIAADEIGISPEASQAYYINRNAQVKVLSNNFSNDHIHTVRLAEIETVNVQDYVGKGYPSEHSHMTLPYILDISEILTRSTGMVSLGSDSKIYESSNNGTSWSEVADLNNFIEGGTRIDAISSATIRNEGIIAGTTDGSLFVEGEFDQYIVRLRKPNV